MDDLKHITVVELDGPNSYLFKVGKNHDWDDRKVPVYKSKPVQIGSEEVIICVTYQPLLKKCIPIIKWAYREASLRRWKKTWYAVKEGKLLQTVEQPEFDGERTLV